ncbi:hypothetical protein JAAARDRAFT_31138 [Jaapia argillacea MUCL 33604]|uniref:Uncharacterized protein n=1 Tax=Jaapia argillacea MUCL 33604 TaxID=933084 RepID=A0A067Q3N4_9AGAM|nr:hypothetical protein JAAARDRAFT_31138 [Jaapia argillacea MUCL 33604]
MKPMQRVSTAAPCIPVGHYNLHAGDSGCSRLSTSEWLVPDSDPVVRRCPWRKLSLLYTLLLILLAITSVLAVLFLSSSVWDLMGWTSSSGVVTLTELTRRATDTPTSSTSSDHTKSVIVIVVIVLLFVITVGCMIFFRCFRRTYQDPTCLTCSTCAGCFACVGCMECGSCVC